MKFDTLLHKITERIGPRQGHQGDQTTAPTMSGAVRFPYGPFQFKVRLSRGALYELQASTEMHNWRTIANGTAAADALDYVDSEASKHSYRFYRVVANGIVSDNLLGYASITLPPGFSLIANPLHAPNNAVAELFKGWPDGTTLNKFDTRFFRLSENAVAHGKWTNASEQLSPGEGAIFYNPTQDYKHHSFVGEVMQGHLSMPIPAGFSMRSSLVPQSGHLQEDLHFPITEGDVIHLFDRDRQKYVLYPFENGKWQSGAPVISVGESFWVAKTSAGNWTRSFTTAE